MPDETPSTSIHHAPIWAAGMDVTRAEWAGRDVEDLVGLSEVVRRVVAARVRDPHLVEDLTQETLVHVAAADPALDGGSRQAYAIVTARNFVVSHARSESVHDRHAHRLVDHTTLAGPEQLTLDREETGALAVALEQLDGDERALLLRHEVDGVTTEAFAAAGATTSGAVAMRLARARATWRLEFLLALRRLALPTAKCGPSCSPCRPATGGARIGWRPRRTSCAARRVPRWPAR